MERYMARVASPERQPRQAPKQEQRTPQQNSRLQQQQPTQQQGPTQKEVQDRLTSLKKAKAAAPVDTHDFLDQQIEDAERALHEGESLPNRLRKAQALVAKEQDRVDRNVNAVKHAEAMLSEAQVKLTTARKELDEVKAAIADEEGNDEEEATADEALRHILAAAAQCDQLPAPLQAAIMQVKECILSESGGGTMDDGYQREPGVESPQPMGEEQAREEELAEATVDLTNTQQEMGPSQQQQQQQEMQQQPHNWAQMAMAAGELQAVPAKAAPMPPAKWQAAFRSGQGSQENSRSLSTFRSSRKPARGAHLKAAQEDQQRRR